MATSTFIAALRGDGVAAPFLIEGAVNAEVFTAYLSQVLCPELKKDDIVVLDNLSTYKITAVAELIAAQGATVRYLPAYSPELYLNRKCSRASCTEYNWGAYKPYLTDRWQAHGLSAARVQPENVAQGFTGSVKILRASCIR